jgi:plastocyanin
MGVIRVAIVAVAALVCLLAAGASGQSPEPGAVSGHVKLTRRIRGAPLPSNAYQPRTVNRHQVSGGPEIKNVVVYLKDAAFRGTLPVTRHEVRQINEAFTPRVLAITRGSTVDFPNADPFFHNVFSLSGPATFDLGRFPKGMSRSRTFAKPGVVRVYCHIHSHMYATILVLDHPYFVVPDESGSFTLPGVPTGRYTVVGWHERVGERTATVQIEAGKTASVDLSLPVEEPQ